MAHRSVPGGRAARALTLTILLGVAPAPSAQGQAAAGGETAEVVKLIDDGLAAVWKANKVTPSAPCTDHEFIRRASLDIIGRIATPAEIQDYLRDPPAARRRNLVERLLKSDDYATNWANLWATWLLTRSGAFGRGTYHEQTVAWLREQFSANRPLNQFATALIAAEGTNTDNAAVNFVLAHVGDPVPRGERGKLGQFEMVPLTARVSRLFLGIQTQCVQCHDHPFDAKLKQAHFWGINAFLRQVRRDGQPPQMQGNRTQTFPPLTLRDDPAANADATVYFEKRNGVILPARAQFLDAGRLALDDETRTPLKGKARRDELARFLVGHENFPKALVNRMWGHFLGRGIVHPVDDFNEQNAPSHPELLDELGKRFRHYGFDQKLLIRWVCNSQAYHLSCAANKTNDKPEQDALFARMLLKSLSPEQLFESLTLATMPQQTREAKREQRARWLDNLIANFGDDEGNEVSFNGTVVQALMMMNGKDLNDALAANDGTVALTIRQRRGNGRQVIADLFLASLNRPPTPAELNKIAAALPLTRGVRDRDLAAPYQDLLWGLLNSNEFMLNH